MPFALISNYGKSISTFSFLTLFSCWCILRCKFDCSLPILLFFWISPRRSGSKSNWVMSDCRNFSFLSWNTNLLQSVCGDKARVANGKTDAGDECASYFYYNYQKSLSSRTLYSFEILLVLFVFWQLFQVPVNDISGTKHRSLGSSVSFPDCFIFFLSNIQTLAILASLVHYVLACLRAYIFIELILLLVIYLKRKCWFGN